VVVVVVERERSESARFGETMRAQRGSPNPKKQGSSLLDDRIERLFKNIQ